MFTEMWKVLVIAEVVKQGNLVRYGVSMCMESEYSAHTVLSTIPTRAIPPRRVSVAIPVSKRYLFMLFNVFFLCGRPCLTFEISGISLSLLTLTFGVLNITPHFSVKVPNHVAIFPQTTHALPLRRSYFLVVLLQQHCPNGLTPWLLMALLCYWVRHRLCKYGCGGSPGRGGVPPIYHVPAPSDSEM